MTKDYIDSCVREQSLSIEQWHEYAKAGVSLSVTTILQGNSMEPLIRYKRDTVTVIPLKRELIPGDIVLFKRQDGAFVVHRFFKACSNGIEVLTWGDNCNYPDRPIKKEEIWGLVICVEKNRKIVRLDTDAQRNKGVKWMNGCVKRKIWFAYQKIKRIGVTKCKIFQKKIL